MLTIAPPPAPALRGPKAWGGPESPPTVTSSVRMKSGIGTSSMAWRTAPASGGWSMPALLTSTPGAPYRSATASSAARSVTSASASSNAPPAASLSASAPSLRTSMPSTCAPAPARDVTHNGPRLPSAPVTTASVPASGRSGTAAGDGVGRRLQDLEGQRLVGDHRVAQRAADQPVELVGRQAVARRLRRDVVLAQHVAGGEVVRRDELLGHL